MANCYLSNNCKKFASGECTYPEFCIKKFKEDKFFDLALISETQRAPISLYLDANACDQVAFDWLNNIKNNISDFVTKGSNLYIFSTTTGNGKTAWSLKLAQSYIGKIWYEKDLQCEVLFLHRARMRESSLLRYSH